MNEELSSGTLYIVSTPIGNLEDITYRAVKLLARVDLIAAEDTRTTKVLLNHYDIHTPLISYYSYNEARRVPELIEKLKRGGTIAVVSDAGTPGISDPAFRLIRKAIDEEIAVVSLPGPTAFLPALITSGLPVEEFVFEGFLPVKKGRQTMLTSLAQERRTIILYESPHRLLRTLGDLQKYMGDREMAVARELTKKFEEIVRGKISFVLQHFTKNPIRGEFVLIVHGIEANTTPEIR
jgi:16S rRNA (cytidine1402-2'-O)-methyltransferase